MIQTKIKYFWAEEIFNVPWNRWQAANNWNISVSFFHQNPSVDDPEAAVQALGRGRWKRQKKRTEHILISGDSMDPRWPKRKRMRNRIQWEWVEKAGKKRDEIWIGTLLPRRSTLSSLLVLPLLRTFLRAFACKSTEMSYSHVFFFFWFRFIVLSFFEKLSFLDGSASL